MKDIGRLKNDFQKLNLFNLPQILTVLVICKIRQEDTNNNIDFRPFID